MSCSYLPVLASTQPENLQKSEFKGVEGVICICNHTVPNLSLQLTFKSPYMATFLPITMLAYKNCE